MVVKINDEEKQLEEPVNISKLLEIHEVEMPEMVSVELNGKILDRADFETIMVKNNDVVEFLYFMGGGSLEF